MTLPGLCVMNGKAERVHLAMNNNNRDYPVCNGIQLKEMLLEDWHPPDRDVLVEEFEERRAAAKSIASSGWKPAQTTTW